MFQMHDPLPAVERETRRRIYREFVAKHKELERISVGCHNDMIMVTTDDDSGAAAAILYATGSPGAEIAFPRHLHSKGETNICLEGHYGETLSADENPDDMFAGATTLDAFQAAHPDVIEIESERDGTVRVLLGPGARWSLGDGSQHRPFGRIAADGVLMAQIWWGGPNQVFDD